MTVLAVMLALLLLAAEAVMALIAAIIMGDASTADKAVAMAAAWLFANTPLTNSGWLVKPA